MKILHISHDYLGSKVYQNLLKELNNLGYKQSVLCFIRKRQIISIKPLSLNSDIQEYLIKLSYFLSSFGRIIPYFRNMFLLRFYNANNLGPYDLVHAHTMVANGSFALMLYKKKKIPYIITIRNSDVNFVLKYFFHLKGLIFQIISCAERIIFVSPVYKERLLEWCSNDLMLQKSILAKAEFIPNGIDDFWLNNIFHPKILNDNDSVNLIFVGEISTNKNLTYLLDVFERLAKSRFKLWIIGGTSKKPENIKHLKSIAHRILKMEGVTYLGEINDKDLLMDYYRKSHIFFMASKFETFGLVYIEAMSQGNPVIYSEGEGIDGYFKVGQIGYPTDGISIDQGEKAIYKILEDYNSMSERCIEKSSEFSWSAISVKYDMMIKNINLKFDKKDEN